MLTHSATLYATAVLIWGSSWFAIRFQLGEVAAEVSIAYRFGLAALLLLAWCRWRGLSLRFSPSQHAWIALQGLMLFCLNYLVLYWATGLLTSGLVAVIFSTIVLFNIVNSALLFGRRVDRRAVLGALFGIGGIALVFWPELQVLSLDDASLRGIVLGVAGTLLASWGNMASARNQRAGIAVVPSNALGMAWAALLLALWAAGRGERFAAPPDLAYGLSLLYLSLFASVLAFGSYLTLLGRIGPERAAYATVLFPLVALAISTLFENYQWTPPAALGVALVLGGNLLILERARPQSAPPRPVDTPAVSRSGATR